MLSIDRTYLRPQIIGSYRMPSLEVESITRIFSMTCTNFSAFTTKPTIFSQICCTRSPTVNNVQPVTNFVQRSSIVQGSASNWWSRPPPGGKKQWFLCDWRGLADSFVSALFHTCAYEMRNERERSDLNDRHWPRGRLRQKSALNRVG